MWNAIPESWLGRRYRIEDSRKQIGTVEFGAWSDSGAIELEGRRLRIQREGFWHRRYLLVDGKDTASARPSGAFRRGFYLVRGDEEYRLDPSSIFGRSYDLTRQGRSLGRIQPVGLFSRRAHIELDDELPPELRLFAFWLVLLTWRRAAAAAS